MEWHEKSIFALKYSDSKLLLYLIHKSLFSIYTKFTLDLKGGGGGGGRFKLVMLEFELDSRHKFNLYLRFNPTVYL